MDIKQALENVVLGKNLSASEMRDVMRQIMTGNATEAQIGAFLVALRMKGESIQRQWPDADIPAVSYTHLTLPTNREV